MSSETGSCWPSGADWWRFLCLGQVLKCCLFVGRGGEGWEKNGEERPCVHGWDQAVPVAAAYICVCPFQTLVWPFLSFVWSFLSLVWSFLSLVWRVLSFISRSLPAKRSFLTLHYLILRLRCVNNISVYILLCTFCKRDWFGFYFWPSPHKPPTCRILSKPRLIHHQRTHLLLIRIVLLFLKRTFLCKVMSFECEQYATWNHPLAAFCRNWD